MEVEVLEEAQLPAVPLQVLQRLLPAGDRHLLLRPQEHPHPVLERRQGPVLCLLADLRVQLRNLMCVQHAAGAQVALALESEQLAV